MKKILFAVKDMNIGGVEKSLLSLLNTLSPEEYSVDILLLESKGGFLDQIPSWVNVLVYEPYASIKEAVNEPPVSVILQQLHRGSMIKFLSYGLGYFFSKLTGNTSWYYRAVFHGLPSLNNRYDIAVSYTSIINYLSWVIVYKVSADRKIGWIHFDVDKLVIDKPIVQELHEKMDKIYVVSQDAKEHFCDMFPSMKDKSEVRYNVVDKNMILKMSDEPVERIKVPDCKTIVTLGRLSAEKGQDIIPDVADILRDRGLRFKWYLIGDGNLRDAIEKRIIRLGLENHIILLGTKKNPYPYIKQADLYVQTSIHEGFCITLAEALIFAQHIISTDCAGAREQLRNGTDCIVQRNADEIANAILCYVDRA